MEDKLNILTAGNLLESKKVAKYIVENIKTCLLDNESLVIALIGNLGAGKTTLVQNIAKELKVKNVSSPTFAIVNEYDGEFHINHFDFYRLNKVEELYDLGFEEYTSKENSITFIEWADMFSEVLPKKFWEIVIEIDEDKTRHYKIKKIKK